VCACGPGAYCGVNPEGSGSQVWESYSLLLHQELHMSACIMTRKVCVHRVGQRCASTEFTFRYIMPRTCATRVHPDIYFSQRTRSHSVNLGNVIAKLSPRGLCGFSSICDQVGPTIYTAHKSDRTERNCSITHTALIVPHGEGQTDLRYVGIWASEGAPRLPLASSE
jgi:hypothetical protein